MKTLQNEVHHPDERSEKVAERRTCFKYSQDALTEFCKKEVNGEEVDFRPTNTPFQLGKSLKDLIERGILSTVEEGLAWQIRKDIQAEIDENKRVSGIPLLWIFPCFNQWFCFQGLLVQLLVFLSTEELQQ